MRQSLLAMLQCPICAGPLAIHEVRASGKTSDEIIEADLRCSLCGTTYPVRRGIPNLLTPRLLEDYKQNEMQGWVNLWNKKGMYERPTPEDSFQLPYLGGIWIEVTRMYEMAMVDMNLQGNEVILDIGAGQGWASRYFAAKGCRVIAIDIVDDELYGLGRAWAIMERAGVYFEPLLADGEHLPFRPNTFDFVFFCGALHHFRDFRKVLRQVNAVLKPGARFIATGEPSLSLIAAERLVQDSLEETHEGIVERRPKTFEYWRSIRQSGFRAVQIDVYDTYRDNAIQVYTWIVAVRQQAVDSVRPLFRPIVWLTLSAILLLPHRWAARLTVHINGGNIFIRGTKPQ
jgi:SAM-dependent methyltransferase